MSNDSKEGPDGEHPSSPIPRDRSAWTPSGAPETPRAAGTSPHAAPHDIGRSSSASRTPRAEASQGAAPQGAHPLQGTSPEGEPPYPEPSSYPSYPGLPRPDDLEPDLRSAPPSWRSTLSVFDHEALAPGFFAVLFLSTAAGLFYVLQEFLGDAVIAFILVGLFRRFYDWLVPKMRQNRWIASGITTLLIFSLIVIPLLLLGYTIALEAANAYGIASSLLADGGEGVVDRAFSRLGDFGVPLSKETAIAYVTQLSSTIQGVVVSWGGQILSNALSITVHLAVVLVLCFYLLVDGPRLKTYLFELSPLPDDEDALLVDTFTKVSRGVIVGNGLGSAIQGILGGLAMWAVGLASPVLWGAVMTLFAFLPLVGISIVVIPASLYLFFRGNTAQAVVFLTFCSIQGLFVENVVKTRLMGSTMRMHDVLVFLSILGGIWAFGIIGLVYGPLLAMMFITLSDLYSRRYRPQLARRYVGRR